MSFPFGMNRVQPDAQAGDPFAIPSTSENQHGSQEQRGSVRARSREREGTRRNDRTVTPGARPRTPRQPPGQPSVQEEVAREDLEGRISALENLAVTHATFLQLIHDDVAGVKQVMPRISEKIISLDGYAQNVDKRVTTVREQKHLTTVKRLLVS